ncbi:family 2 encapsulin nanocompartment cargo protein polyprenyl transferase [Amycolatopsis alba]|uniref:Dimethylallyltranstransferase n=1 Tax=Amycolatopsis alba DSM 44262 TaxID=1125972 RepID=A0A229RLP0_AMYAL|nr:family 2 encapsulin nanocompartment cargo protein polyprenyl transferase [Amycolatopsis alba]OXM47371.1 dimethylallyltranstransferase [Amycolatopsis alba DSM 44262]
MRIPVPRSEPAILTQVRGVLDPGLRAAVDRLPEPVRTVAGYHFGWWDERGEQADASGGKALRPALVFGCAQAVGGDVTDAVAGAVAVELVHNFSLLHDDIMDGDHTRRHRRSAWVVFGSPHAVLAGDALVSLALEVLAEAPHPAAGQGLRMVSGAIAALIQGQSMDLDFETRAAVDLAQCLSMAHGKTAALLGCACGLGALLGGGTGRQIECLSEFGRHLGMAFQLIDDLLGIWGDSQVTGKPVFADLQRRKKSLPVVAALNSHSTAGAELAEFYSLDRPLTAPELTHVAHLIEAGGGREWARVEADRQVHEALARLDQAEPAPGPADEFAALAGLILRRDH